MPQSLDEEEGDLRNTYRPIYNPLIHPKPVDVTESVLPHNICTIEYLTIIDTKRTAYSVFSLFSDPFYLTIPTAMLAITAPMKEVRFPFYSDPSSL
jgi:hypothetical protein